MGELAFETGTRRRYQPDPDVANHESRVISVLLSMVADLVLDLDITVTRARDLFTLALYERAEHRFRTSTRISLAFDTALRTVKKIKRKWREGLVDEADGPLYNMRRKVYLMLLGEPMELETISRELPINYEVNYARLAVETLMEQGLVEERVEHGRVLYRAVLPKGHVDLTRNQDRDAAIEGFDRFLTGLRKLARERLIKGNTGSLARGFVVRCRPEDAAELRDELRAAVVQVLMGFERRADDLLDDQVQEMEVLLGLTPA